MKKSCLLKLDRYLDRKSIYWDLWTKLDKILKQAEYVEIYEIKISRFDFRLMLTCMCRVSFLTILDIYKAYFKSRYTWRTHAESDLVPYSLCKKYCDFCALGFCNQVLLDFHYWWSDEPCNQQHLLQVARS